MNDRFILFHNEKQRFLTHFCSKEDQPAHKRILYSFYSNTAKIQAISKQSGIKIADTYTTLEEHTCTMIQRGLFELYLLLSPEIHDPIVSTEEVLQGLQTKYTF